MSKINKIDKLNKTNSKLKIVITGAGTGIGKEVAIKLSKRGHTVYATTYLESESIFLNNFAKDNNLNLVSFKLDILNKSDLKKLDNLNFDVLINNAALCASGSVLETPIVIYKKIIDTNILANINVSQIAIKRFIEKKKGKIIFVSSLFGIVATPFYSPYCLSKFAIECFSKCLKSELKLLQNEGINIQIKTIVPGAYKTGFNEKMAKIKYEWMKKHSYFKHKLYYIQKLERKLWNFIELKNLNSITKQYIKAVENDNKRFKYNAPKLQVF